MRKYIRDRIVELIPTVIEGLDYAREANIEQAATVLEDCRYALNSISQTLKVGLTDQRFAYYDEQLVRFQEVLSAIYHNKTAGHPIPQQYESCENMLVRIRKDLLEESEVKLEVVFMPYKRSMWDSLESIWQAASNDARCNVSVVPIPYYDKNPDRSLGTLHYEGADYPDHVPITHYDSYEVSAHQPDIIYIHNPYDNTNTVTTVDPRYYSYNLKGHTSMLVYVPYFISGAYADMQAFASKHLMSCVQWVDKIIVQSETHRKLYMDCGVDGSKVAALGSPKFDVVTSNYTEERNLVPEEWSEKLAGRKSIVLNSSIGSLLINPRYFDILKNRISAIMSFPELVLIWRPHPLLEATIKSMRPAFLDDYLKLIDLVRGSDKAILDLSSNTEGATFLTDGMISDNSSWARQYIATGKPVLLLNGTADMKAGRSIVFDYFSSYFIRDGIGIEDFCGMVLNGADPKKEMRLAELRGSILNIDGSCGKKIHDYVTLSLEK